MNAKTTTTSTARKNEIARKDTKTNELVDRFNAERKARRSTLTREEL